MKYSSIIAAAMAASMAAFGAPQAKTLPNNGLSPEETAKRQARSVHLRYHDREPRISGAAVTVTVHEAHPGSYFMALGWSCGYCGIQELRNGSHVLLFSVWDPGDPHDYDAKPDTVKEEIRAKVLYSHPDMQVSRFGGEGTGAKTMAQYDWKVGEPVRFKVEIEPDGTNRTAFTCSLQDASDNGGWRRLATISTMNINGSAPDFGLLHSFVEDFLRNYDSAKLARRAEFSDIAVLSTDDGQWHPVQRAWFTGDSTPSTNVDGGRVPGNPHAFFLATGGSTTNATTSLWKEVK